MDKISDKELVKVILDKVVCCGLRYVEDCQCDECKKTTVTKNELISRLERGRIAIEAMEKIEDLLSTGAPLMWTRGEYIEEASRWEKELVRIFRDYQQSCKEDTE